MKNNKTFNSLILVFCTVVILILLIFAERHFRHFLEDKCTPSVQKEISVQYTIREVDTGKIVSDDTYPASIIRNTLIMAISFGLVYFFGTIILALVYYLIKKFSKFEFNIKIFYYVKWFVELSVIILGIFTVVYTSNAVDFTKYGLEKNQLEEENDNKYFDIEEKPYVVSDLRSEDDPEPKITYDNKFVSKYINILSVFIAVVGCMTFLMGYIIDYEEFHPDYEELNDQIEEVIKERKLLDQMERRIYKDLEGKIQKCYIDKLNKTKEYTDTSKKNRKDKRLNKKGRKN